MEGRQCVLSSLESERGQKTSPYATGRIDNDDANTDAKPAVSRADNGNREWREYTSWSEQD